MMTFYIGIYSLFLIALALALDAFGVSLSIGLNSLVRARNKMWFCLSFGFFQFLFSFLGAFLGFLFNTYILSIPKIIGGIVIAIVGILMLKDGIDNKNDNILLSKKIYLILGISVSIDAAVVGFTVLNSIISPIALFEAAIFIGLITLIMCIIAFIAAGHLRKIELVSRYADYTGGIILIFFALKMIFF